MLLLIQNFNTMKNIFILFFIFSPLFTFAQSKTTQNFHKEHDDAMVLFAYHNTLKMFAQVEGAAEAGLDELFKDIDKMKFVKVDVTEEEAKSKIKQLATGYKKERFEDLMSMRHDGMNVRVYIQEDSGVTSGVVLLMNDKASVSIIDIVGRVPLNKVASLISQVQKMQ